MVPFPLTCILGFLVFGVPVFAFVASQHKSYPSKWQRLLKVAVFLVAMFLVVYVVELVRLKSGS